MSFPTITFTKNWEDPRDFPTIETSEAQVRSDIQLLFDELASVINGTASILNGTSQTGSAADNLGITPVTGLEGSTVQSALESAGTQIEALNEYVATGGITREEADSLYEPLTSAAAAFHNASFNTATSTLVFTRKDGATISVELPAALTKAAADALYEPLTSAANAFHNASFNSTTNSMVFTKKSGSTVSVQIPVGATPVSMTLTQSGNTYILTITYSDGSSVSCDVGSLLNSDMPINGGTWG